MRPSISGYLNPARSLVFASASTRDVGRHPIGKVVTCTPLNSAFGHGRAFQVRVILPDGTLWSGRSSSGGDYATLYKLKQGSQRSTSVRRAFFLPNEANDNA